MKTTIIEHDIKWSCDNDTVTELGDSDIQYIEEQIGKGNTSGELNIGEDEVRGWWELVDWRDIALDLKVALENSLATGIAAVSKKNEAIDRFNENW